MKKFLAFITCSLCFFSLTPIVQTQACSLHENSYKGQEIVDNYTSVVETKDNPYLKYESSEVGGGWWRRGLCGINNISEYKHYTRKGRASCENGNGTFHDGGWALPQGWSKARVFWTPWGGNRAYYDHD